MMTTVTYITEVKNLIQPAVDKAGLDISSLRQDQILKSFFSFAKVYLCKTCKGAGVFRNGSTCPNCKGQCTDPMKGVRPTIEEIQARIDSKIKIFVGKLNNELNAKERKAIETAKRLAIKALQVESNRQTSITKFAEKDQRALLKALESTNDLGSFIDSVRTQWRLYGKLSEAQARAILQK